MTPQNVLQKAMISYANIISGQRTADKIRAFGSLSEGWHYGRGNASSENIIEECLRIHSRMIGVGFHETDAFPGIDGEVLLTAYHEYHYIDILVELDGCVTITHEIGDTVVSRKGGLSEASCREELVKMAGDIWKPSASYTFDTSIIRGGALRVWHSRTRQKTEVSRSLNKNAYFRQALAFANTSRHTIERPLVIPSFFGHSTQNYFLRTG